MAIVCPTVTAYDMASYHKQLHTVQQFATRIHLDFMDGSMTEKSSILLRSAYWQPGPRIDFHLMYRQPLKHIEEVIHMQPHLVVIQAEADGAHEFLQKLKGFGIQRGISLLAETPVSKIVPMLDDIDHVLIFSGHLGYFGGSVDLSLLKKVTELKLQKPNLEIGWDGGINDTNANDLIQGGVEVLNTGGFIQKSENPEEAYDRLVAVTREGTSG